MKVFLDPGAYIPTRSHPTDAGLDIRSRETKMVPARGSAVFETGVHIELPRGYAGFIKSKSGLNVNNGIVSEGVIDEGYQGQIIVKLYNHSDDDYKVMAGDKLTQLIVTRVSYVDVNVVNEFTKNTSRGSNGIGSTGR